MIISSYEVDLLVESSGNSKTATGWIACSLLISQFRPDLFPYSQVPLSNNITYSAMLRLITNLSQALCKMSNDFFLTGSYSVDPTDLFALPTSERIDMFFKLIKKRVSNVYMGIEPEISDLDKTLANIMALIAQLALTSDENDWLVPPEGRDWKKDENENTRQLGLHRVNSALTVKDPRLQEDNSNKTRSISQSNKAGVRYPASPSSQQKENIQKSGGSGFVLPGHVPIAQHSILGSIKRSLISNTSSSSSSSNLAPKMGNQISNGDRGIPKLTPQFRLSGMENQQSQRFQIPERNQKSQQFSSNFLSSVPTPSPTLDTVSTISRDKAGSSFGSKSGLTIRNRVTFNDENNELMKNRISSVANEIRRRTDYGHPEKVNSRSITDGSISPTLSQSGESIEERSYNNGRKKTGLHDTEDGNDGTEEEQNDQNVSNSNSEGSIMAREYDTKKTENRDNYISPSSVPTVSVSNSLHYNQQSEISKLQSDNAPSPYNLCVNKNKLSEVEENLESGMKNNTSSNILSSVVSISMKNPVQRETKSNAIEEKDDFPVQNISQKN